MSFDYYVTSIVIQKNQKQQRRWDKENKKLTRQQKSSPCTFDLRTSPFKNLFHNTFKPIEMNFYLGYLWYCYYSTQQNYGGQKKKSFSLWELLMFWNTFDSLSGKSTEHFLLIWSTEKKSKMKNPGVSPQNTAARGSQKIPVWMET